MKVDLMPVDIAINLMCVLAPKVASQTSSNLESKGIPVFNCTSGSVAPIKWKHVQSQYDNLYKHPFENMLWYPHNTPMKNNYYHDRISRVLFHWIPAYCIDSIVYIAQVKPLKLVKIVSKMTKAIEDSGYGGGTEDDEDTDDERDAVRVTVRKTMSTTTMMGVVFQ